MAVLTMAQALNAALRDALREDPSVLVFGEDVGHLGGVFRVTDGLTTEFGEDRCFDTPLTEAGIVGMAVGMAMYGYRPVVEMQFDAFAYPAFEQITSHVAKMRNRTRGRVALPMVIRVPYGGGIGGVEHHSDSSEAYYTHTPGLRVVTPGTATDAYSLLRASIASPDPVIFLEPKRCYWTKAETTLTAGTEPMDRAVVQRQGRDVTLVAYGPTVRPRAIFCPATMITPVLLATRWAVTGPVDGRGAARRGESRAGGGPAARSGCSWLAGPAPGKDGFHAHSGDREPTGRDGER